MTTTQTPALNLLPHTAAGDSPHWTGMDWDEVLRSQTMVAAAEYDQPFTMAALLCHLTTGPDTLEAVTRMALLTPTDMLLSDSTPPVFTDEPEALAAVASMLARQQDDLTKPGSYAMSVLVSSVDGEPVFTPGSTTFPDVNSRIWFMQAPTLTAEDLMDEDGEAVLAMLQSTLTA